jgi:poly(A) polymerase
MHLARLMALNLHWDAVDQYRRTPAVQAVLEAAAGPVHMVGGSVRDLLLDRPVNDLDLVMAGPVEEAAERAAEILGCRAAPLGRPPLVTYRLTHKDLLVDLTPLPGDLEDDLLRRDLTINALAVDLTAENGPAIVDPAGGLADLEAGLVRFVSEANVLADPLRLLRLFRFAAVLGMTPDDHSLGLAGAHAPLIRRAAGERIREELLKMLSADRAHPHLLQMADAGLLTAVVPEMSDLKGLGQGPHHHLDVFKHTLTAFGFLEELIRKPDALGPAHEPAVRDYLAVDRRPALLKIAVLFHDLGKPPTYGVDETGQVHFFGHEKESTALFKGVADRLRLSGAEVAFVSRIIENHMRLFHLLNADRQGQLTPRGVYRFGRAVGDHVHGVILHNLADARATQGPAQVQAGGYETIRDFAKRVLDMLTEQGPRKAAPPLLTGHEVMERFGLPPGPTIGRLLDQVAEARAVGRVETFEEALALIERILSEEPRGNPV